MAYTQIRYGIMGAASIVPRIIAGIKESPNSRVVAIAARHLGKAQAMATKFEIPTAYGSYEQLCEDEHVDVVYIPLWNAGHYPGAKLALQHHKNVLLEKPFTLTYQQAKELFTLARENDCLLMEGQKAAFLPITTQVRHQLLEKKAIGEVCGVTDQEAHPGIEKIPWFHDVKVGGGAFYGSAAYILEYLQLVLQTDITAFQGQITHQGAQADDQTQLNLQLASGPLASVFMTTLTASLPSQITFWGTQGSLTVPNYWKTDTYQITTSQGTNVFTQPQKSEFVYEFNHVSELVLRKETTSPVMTSALTLKTMKIIETLYQDWYPEQLKNS